MGLCSNPMLVVPLHINCVLPHRQQVHLTPIEQAEATRDSPQDAPDSDDDLDPVTRLRMESRWTREDKDRKSGSD